MKFRRFLSYLIFGFGCMLCFIGLLAIVLPSLQNPRLQLVLAGFDLKAANPLAEGINRFVRFVRDHEWPVFYLGLLAACTGTALLLYFSPKPVPSAANASAPPNPVQVHSQSTIKPNPFARAVCNPASATDNTRYSVRIEPVLERNITDEPLHEFAKDEDVQPYFSPRLTAESRAVETTSGSLSQSGSRILIRTVPEELPAPQDETHAAKPDITVLPPPVSSAPAQPVSSRIRSTMGRHTH